MNSAINWMVEKSDVTENSGEYGSYKMWTFSGKLPAKMVQELRAYVHANGKRNGDAVYNVRLVHTETYGKSIVLTFGSKRSTENTVKFKMTEEWAA